MTQKKVPEDRQRSRLTTFQTKQIVIFRRRGYSMAATAEALQLSRDTVKTFCRRHPELDAAPVKKTPGLCRNCEKPLDKTAVPQQRVFCSSACREAWWKQRNLYHPSVSRKPLQCAGCGVQFFSPKPRRRYCSHECYIQHRFSASSRIG